MTGLPGVASHGIPSSQLRIDSRLYPWQEGSFIRHPPVPVAHPEEDDR